LLPVAIGSGHTSLKGDTSPTNRFARLVTEKSAETKPADFLSANEPVDARPIKRALADAICPQQD
jgi:hypothetical protein